MKFRIDRWSNFYWDKSDKNFEFQFIPEISVGFNSISVDGTNDIDNPPFYGKHFSLTLNWLFFGLSFDFKTGDMKT